MNKHGFDLALYTMKGANQYSILSARLIHQHIKQDPPVGSEGHWITYIFELCYFLGQDRSKIQSFKTMLARYILFIVQILVIAQAQVTILDDSNYTVFINKHPYVFLEFYAPWCGHCKNLIPQYDKLGAAAIGKNYIIAKVDATINEKFSKEANIEGYPTLKFALYGIYIDYNGPTTANQIQEWINSLLSSKIQPINEQEVQKKIGKEEFLLIQGVSPKRLQILNIIRVVERTVNYYYLDNQQNKIALHLKNSKIINFEGELTVKGMITWIHKHYFSFIVPLLTKDHGKIVFQNKEKLPSFLLFKNTDFTAKATGYLEAICEEYKSSFKCALVDPTYDTFNEMNNFVKGIKDGKSLLVYLPYGQQQKYIFHYPVKLSSIFCCILEERIIQFLQDIKECKIEKSLISAHHQEQKYINLPKIQRLTVTTYNKTLSTNKFVFVQYYSPNCGHCTEFAPQYQKLANIVKNNKYEYVVAAVDLMAQQKIMEWIQLQEYPALRFYINGHQLDYSGPRTAEIIISFMNSIANSKLPSLQEIFKAPIPFVAIYGISLDSDLHFISALFTKYPIYSMTSNRSFCVEFHNKEIHTFIGKQNLSDVLAWLQELIQPVVINILHETSEKRLTKAFNLQTPLLLIVIRDETANKGLITLEQFCCKRDQLLCCSANKNDLGYDYFNDWLQNPEPGKSVIIYIKTDTLERQLFKTDLATMTIDDLQIFVKNAKTEIINNNTEGQIKMAKQITKEINQAKAANIEHHK